MSRKIFLLFMVFLCTNLAFAQESIIDYEYLKIDIENQIAFELDFENNYKIEKFEVNSNFLPQTIENAQYLNSFESSNSRYRVNEEENDFKLSFFYGKSNLKEKNYIDNYFVLESTIYRPKVMKKQEFPITEFNESNKEYLEMDGLIDSTDEMQKEVSRIVEGRDDVYEVALTVADWIEKYVDYDLSTLTENPDQSASEIFDSKKGVCKEITILYVSMMRQLGVPARIATGFSYTNSEELVEFVGSNWGGHAWAEVLIDGQWVPFDLTYKQYGFVDASHIILERGSQVNLGSVSINASGNGIKIIEGALRSDTKFEIVEKTKKIEAEKLKIVVDGTQKLSYDSYGYINLSIENKDNFYKVLYPQVSKVKEVTEINGLDLIFLKPEEKKEIYYTFKIPKVRKSGYQVIYPFIIWFEDEKITYNVSVSENYLYFEKENLPKAKEIELKYSQNQLDFDCFVIFGKTNKAACEVKNPNNYIFKDVYVCVDSVCEENDLSIYETRVVTFNIGKKDFATVRYFYGNVDETVPVELEKPEIVYDYELSENGVLSLEAEIENYYENQNLEVYKDGKLVKQFEMQKEKIAIPLDEGFNEINIELYVDGDNYSQRVFEVRVPESGFWGFFKNLWFSIFG